MTADGTLFAQESPYDAALERKTQFRTQMSELLGAVKG